MYVAVIAKSAGNYACGRGRPRLVLGNRRLQVTTLATRYAAEPSVVQSTRFEFVINLITAKVDSPRLQ
jgi:hypothetical protein